jgi:hypothetical protein
MSQSQYSLSSVWPQPSNTLTYVEQSFPDSGDFISTGQFDPADIGANGRGRTSANCKRVTSLFFDADLIGLNDALRVQAGEILEPKVADRKPHVYAKSAQELSDLKDRLLSTVGEHLCAVMGTDPTAIIDSGWGYHFHYAVDGFAPADHASLKEAHIRIVDEVNRRVSAELSSWTAALDNTNDVGARLARKVGSINIKCRAKPKSVEVLVENKDVCIRAADLPAILANCAVPATQTASGSSSHAPRASKMQREHRDFRLEYMNDGRSWQEIVDGMQPGDKLNVVCPFGGTSPGSAFFVKEGTGRSRLVSNAQQVTYMNSYVAPVAPPPAPPSGGRKPVGQRAALVSRRDRDGNATGVPENTLLNLQAVLRDDGRMNLWWDDFLQIAMNGDEPLSEDAYIDTLLMLETDYNWVREKPGKEILWSTILRMCRENKRNPVKDYLRGLKWDGQPRLENWLWNVVYDGPAHSGCPINADADLLKVYSRKWAISLVARVLDPGCKVDTMLVLAGRQSFKKSGIFRAWAGQWFVDQQIDPRNKDSLMVLNRAWIYEDAELASTRMSDGDSLKNFLTRQTDTFRAPYERFVKDQPRHFVIGGTTNEDSFLRDRTGNRRFWVCEVPSFPDLKPEDENQPQAELTWLRANRDQLLAEAVHLFDAGKQSDGSYTDYLWWLAPKEEMERGKQNEGFRFLSVWDEAAQACFEANCGGIVNGFNAGDFAYAVDPDLSNSQIAKIGLTLSSALNAAGFRKSPTKVKGKTIWHKPVPAGATPLNNDGLDAVRGKVLRVAQEQFRK